MANTRKAAYAQGIETEIENIRARVTDHKEYFEREEHTRYALIDPMLRALGWDLGDPSQVQVEYEIGKGRGLRFVSSGSSETLDNRGSQRPWEDDDPYDDDDDDDDDEFEDDEEELDDPPMSYQNSFRPKTLTS